MARMTVGVPVYNGEAMIAECLNCLLSQTCHDFVMVIADNASTAETSEICAEYVVQDNRVGDFQASASRASSVRLSTLKAIYFFPKLRSLYNC